jgi:hypothetical protein
MYFMEKSNYPSRISISYYAAVLKTSDPAVSSESAGITAVSVFLPGWRWGHGARVEIPGTDSIMERIR